MIPARRAPWVGALVGAYVLALVLLLVWAAFKLSPPDTATALREGLRPVLLPLLLLLLIGTAVMALVAGLIHESYAGGIARLAERVGVMTSTGDARPLPVQGVPEMRSLLQAINGLAAAHAAALGDVEARVRQARADSDAERERLAALIGQLSQAVIVCNAQGQIVLYNPKARDLLDNLVGAASSFVGLGRPLAGVLEPELVGYLQEFVATSAAPGQSLTVMSATSGGRLLRLHVTPVVQAGASADHAGGMVLMVEDVTRVAELDARRARTMQETVQTQRSGLASIRLAAEAMYTMPELSVEERERSLRVVRDEADRLSRHLAEVMASHAELWSAGWQLESMHGTALLMAACRRIEARTGVICQVEYAESELWLRTDSFSLIQALSFLAKRISEAFDLRELRLRLTRHEQLAHLDIVWSGTALSTETALGWELEPMTQGGESSPLTVREVVARHDAELVYQRDRASTRAWFRWLLPADESARSSSQPETVAAGRPEYFDFDLFANRDAFPVLDDTPLDRLSFTVFDTETTGLDPSGGDEIIQIGAVRILNGRLLRNESYAQLVDPRRAISASAIAVHGITPERLRGQPTIDQVLPQFHAFAANTVLVGHNVAFDMRFLQMKEARCGLRFEQPVLDTLLLSVVLHPNHDSHRLEALAERFGLGVVDRHSAMGDAVLTAQLFLRMIPLLAARGLHTLGQVRAASKETWHARIRY